MEKSNRNRVNTILIIIAAIVFFISYFLPQILILKTSIKYVDYKDGCMVKSYRQAFYDDNTHLQIPQEVDGKKVIKVEEYAFYNCQKLEKISLPDSVVEIGKGAFKNSKKLKNVDFGEGVYYIGEDCFLGSESLENITIPEKVTSIKKRCFKKCPNLKNVRLHKNIKNIEKYSFSKCESLESVEIYKNTQIDEHAFLDCPAQINIVE